ncbi:CAMK family protein kinase [Histomonas meleagridis]|uniref:CAMK family protein kinase n=1 Tax=Histomonas meleagridis TaxID=135588 RepID=UPI00355A98CC|nr:CAMK family protein kinase [Histomonas meleagridis]KAH0799393.1 CAMK family protein kinase [Histomonas meleagridis]
MIKHNSRTSASDIWCCGIILYFLVSGKLPFFDENTQRLLQKIVYTEVQYPPFLSTPLTDLLKKLLLKDPEKRPNLSSIREHAWFSQSEYAILEDFKLKFDSVYNTINDKEIIDQISNAGINITGVTNPFDKCDTAIFYRQLARQKIKEMMKELKDKLMTCRKPQPRRRLLFSMPNGEVKAQERESLPQWRMVERQTIPTSQSATQMDVRSLMKVKTLSRPNPNLVPRRMSRPVAVRKPIIGSEVSLQSQEM